jgi:uncharacterized protein YndB with AHSA1/START domain
VLTWNPGEKLVFTWQISRNREPVPDPQNAGEVAVEFHFADDGTLIDLTHRHFERHEGDGEEYCEMMGSDYGWPLILKRFSDFVVNETRRSG